MIVAGEPRSRGILLRAFDAAAAQVQAGLGGIEVKALSNKLFRIGRKCRWRLARFKNGGNGSFCGAALGEQTVLPGMVFRQAFGCFPVL